MTTFTNASGLEFKDLHSEEWREYTFPCGAVVRLTAPLKIHVSGSGGHRLFTADGCSHYIPAGWIKLSWRAKEGQPHFDF